MARMEGQLDSVEGRSKECSNVWKPLIFWIISMFVKVLCCPIHSLLAHACPLNSFLDSFVQGPLARFHFSAFAVTNGSSFALLTLVT